MHGVNFLVEKKCLEKRQGRKELNLNCTQSERNCIAFSLKADNVPCTLRRNMFPSFQQQTIENSLEEICQHLVLHVEYFATV